MKNTTNTRAPFTSCRTVFLPAVFFFLISVAGAQTIPHDLRLRSTGFDPDFPRQRGLHGGIMGTYANIAPPPAIVGDLTLGVRPRFSLGILAGTTGAQTLAGLKANAILFQSGAFRLTYRMVILYYPGRDGKFLFDREQRSIIPWMLSMASVDADFRTAHGIRWSLGMGVMETHCVEGMKKFFFGHGDERKIMPFEFFHVVKGSVSIPLSSRVALGPEVVVIMKDWKLIPMGKFRVFPVHPFVKAVYKF